MAYTLAQAAATTGRNRSSVLRAIKQGKLSAVRDEATAEWRIEPAELHRLYPAVDAPVRTARRIESSSQVEIRELRNQLDDKDATIDDLRSRLDEERTERRQTADRLAAAQERIAALLTDQRAAPAPAPAPPRRFLWLRRARA